MAGKLASQARQEAALVEVHLVVEVEEEEVVVAAGPAPARVLEMVFVSFLQ